MIIVSPTGSPNRIRLYKSPVFLVCVTHRGAIRNLPVSGKPPPPSLSWGTHKPPGASFLPRARRHRPVARRKRDAEGQSGSLPPRQPVTRGDMGARDTSPVAVMVPANGVSHTTAPQDAAASGGQGPCAGNIWGGCRHEHSEPREGPAIPADKKPFEFSAEPGFDAPLSAWPCEVRRQTRPGGGGG